MCTISFGKLSVHGVHVFVKEVLHIMLSSNSFLFSTCVPLFTLTPSGVVGLLDVIMLL